MITVKDKENIKNYTLDAANYTGSADRVYIPESTDEINDILKQCNEENTPVTISAARTGLTGGGVPHKGVVLSVERLKRILKIDKENLTTLVEPGVRLAELQQELDQHGLLYPSNPTETWSAVGGNIATNASGAKTFKYGPTRSFVNYIEVALIDGDEIHLRRGEQKADGNHIKLKTVGGRNIEFDIPNLKYPQSSKNASGYFLHKDMDIIDLFIGSEGTLGVIKNAELTLQHKPEELISCIVFFNDKDRILDFVDVLRETNDVEDKDEISVRLIEYFDGNSLDLLRELEPSLPENTAGAVWIEQETDSEHIDTILEKIYELILKYSDMSDETWMATNEAELRKITDFRHKLPLSVNEFLSEYGQQKIYTDTAVPVEKFRDYYKTMYEGLENTGLDYVVFGHIGNCHLHANLFMKDESDRAKANIFFHNMVDLALEYNGTFSAEHGVGKIKTEFLPKMYSESEVEEMKKIKRIFDPKMLLGIGTIFS